MVDPLTPKPTRKAEALAKRILSNLRFGFPRVKRDFSYEQFLFFSA
jgi:hypothetical protein